MNPLIESVARLEPINIRNNIGFSGKSFSRWRNNQPYKTPEVGAVKSEYSPILNNYFGLEPKNLKSYMDKISLPQTNDHYFIKEGNPFNMNLPYSKPSGNAFQELHNEYYARHKR